MAQQFKNAFFDLDDYPSLCICDRDQIFEGRFERMLRNYYRIKLRRTPYQSPSKNGRVERFHLSLKSEAFRNVVPINLEQAQRVCTEYKKYYNHHRPHQGIAGKIPGNSNQKKGQNSYKIYSAQTILAENIDSHTDPRLLLERSLTNLGHYLIFR